MKKIKTSLLFFASFLTLMLALSMIAPVISAVDASEIKATFPTYGFLAVNPDPIGVGQSVSAIFWLDSAPPQNIGAEYYGWQDLTVTITKPDGTTETKGPFESDSLGSNYFIYTPDAVGKYTFQLSFPGQTVEITSASPFMTLDVGTYYYEPCESAVVDLTVQTEEVTSVSEAALPTDYWSFPITAENREWYKIAGNWLSSSTTFAPYTEAPNTAHILWTKQLSFGGIAGGDLGYGINYYNAHPYEILMTPPVIISGRMYYNIYAGAGFGGGLPGVTCVDLRTGEEIWVDEDMPQIAFGQVFNFKGANGYGALAYLWSTVGRTYYEMYDAFTGRLTTTVQDVGMGTNAYGPNGELLIYMMDGVNNKLSMWNSTLAVMNGTTQWASEAWRPPARVNFTNGIQWEASIPPVSGGTPSIGLVDYESDVIVAEAPVTSTMQTSDPTFIHIGYSATTGQQLWTQSRSGLNWGFMGPSSPGLISGQASAGGGVYTIFQKETMTWHGFDITTGEKLWSTEPMNVYTNDDYSMYDWTATVAYDTLYVTGYSGCVTAFNVKTGEHLWTYSQGSSGLTTPYPSWPCLNGVIVADDKVFVPTQEHTPNSPMLKGYNLIAIDAYSGEEIWQISSFSTTYAIAGGELVVFNDYDRRAYAFGKGKTATTVSVNDGVIDAGETVLISGTITDQSPGAADTAAIADDDMTAWMEYLYQQQDMPTNAKGVTVHLTAVNSNGDREEIGYTTSDMTGLYSILWTPQNEGLYTIVAAFEGSNSYYASVGETSLSVSVGVDDAVESQSLTYSIPTEFYALAAAIVIVVVIAIAIATAILKKK